MIPLSCLLSRCLRIYRGCCYSDCCCSCCNKHVARLVQFAHSLLVFNLQDYQGEIDTMLREEQIFTEDGRFNKALLARPGPENKRPRTGKPADPDAPFVPVQSLATRFKNYSSYLACNQSLFRCFAHCAKYRVLPPNLIEGFCEPCLLSAHLTCVVSMQIWAHPKYGDRVDVGLVRHVEEAVKAQEVGGNEPCLSTRMYYSGHKCCAGSPYETNLE